MAFTSNLNEKNPEATRRLKKSLRKFPPTTWNDVYNRYNTKLWIKEYTIALPRVDERARSRRSELDKRAGKTCTSLTWVLNVEILGPNRKTYDLNRDQDKKMRVLHLDSESMGDKMWWPKEIRLDPSKRNPDYWCEFHNHHSHRTSDCKLLQGEIEHLLKQGYPTDLFIEKAAKKTSKITATNGKRIRQTLEEESITFDDEDAYNLMIPHKDAQVISLLVHNTNVKRVLIDSGSSMNIILLRVVNEMQTNNKMIPKAWSLSKFDNSSVITKGEVVLATFAEGVIKDTKFQVIDADMVYNIILGRL
uniref:Uncharacterized protein n=1 Tax=Nicotiana tabacum TaxID=4097 RepID=A0A1S3X8B3_TOBAC|nr:PREDICTED: uncharacterized protein LOC107762296 [Nicotiana tabacum]